MELIALWIGTSAFVGFLGRRRRGGFWALFFFSLVLSPVVGLISLLLARRQPRRTTRSIGGRQADLDLPALREETHWLVVVLSRVTFGTLLVAWLVIVLAFGTMYWRIVPALDKTGARIDFGYVQALELSLDVATLGFQAAIPEDMPRVPLAFERLAVLLLLVLMVARLTLRNPAIEVAHVRQVAAARADRMRDIEQALARQQELLDSLRAHLEAQRDPPAAVMSPRPH